MKKLIVCFVNIIAIASIYSLGCQKNQLQGSSNELPQSYVEYRDTQLVSVVPEIYKVDGVTVTKNQFTWGLEGKEYHISVGEKNNPTSQTVYYMAFSDKNTYDTFLEEEPEDFSDLAEEVMGKKEAQ